MYWNNLYATKNVI